MTKVELLSPAGNLEKLETVLRYGADAAYLGLKEFNLRAGSQNFTDESLADAVQYAHGLGKKIFVTINALARNDDIKKLPAVLQLLDQIKVDAVIVADLGVLSLVKEHSSLPVHISTQASVLNYQSVKMYQKLGAQRIILARELTLNEIAEIRQLVPDIELEVFVHGAMCMSYSGRCNISKYLTSRDGNRGECTNPCRWQYTLMEEKRPGEYFPVFEDDTGSYIYNSRDLCTIEFLDKVIATGVNSLKIEGRGKGILYGAVTARMYRTAIDSIIDGQYSYSPLWRRELETFTHRDYTSGFYLGGLDAGATGPDGKTHHPYQLAGKVLRAEEGGFYLVHTRNQLRTGMQIEAVYPDRPAQTATIRAMRHPEEQSSIDIIHPNNYISIAVDIPLTRNDLLRAHY